MDRKNDSLQVLNVWKEKRNYYEKFTGYVVRHNELISNILEKMCES